MKTVNLKLIRILLYALLVNLPMMLQAQSLTCPAERDLREYVSENIDLTKGASSLESHIEVFWRKTSSPPPTSMIHFVLRQDLLSLNGTLQYLYPEIEFSPESIEIWVTDIGRIGGLFCSSLQPNFEKFRVLVSPQSVEDSSEFRRVFSHELVHYAFWKKSIQIAPWFEEGLAYLFESEFRGRLSGAILKSHLDNPQSPLVVDSDKLHPDDNRPSITGHAFLFAKYLYRRFNTSLFEFLIQTNDRINTQNKIDQVLRSHFSTNFEQVFIDFQIAKWVNAIDYINSEVSEKYYIDPNIRKPNREPSSNSPHPWSSQTYFSLDKLKESRRIFQESSHRSRFFHVTVTENSKIIVREIFSELKKLDAQSFVLKVWLP